MRRCAPISMAAIVFAALAIPGRLLAQAPAALQPDSPEVVKDSGREFSVFRLPEGSPLQHGGAGALWVVLLVAVAGLVYAGMLVGQVLGADQGTEKMRTVARAIREGANAYLARQFKAIILLVFLITAILYFANAGEGRAGTSVPAVRWPSSSGRRSPGWSAMSG